MRKHLIVSTLRDRVQEEKASIKSKKKEKKRLQRDQTLTTFGIYKLYGYCTSYRL